MADGQPTGLVLEPPAWGAINQMIPPRPPERLLKAANSAAQTLNAFGITGVQDAYVSREVLQSWQRADAQPGGLPLRVVTSLAQDNVDPAIVVPPRSAEAEQARSERLRPDYAKLFLDGVPMAFTAAMLAPYLPSPMHNHGHDFKGEALYSLPDLVKRLAAWDKQGVPVKLHSVGDGAVRLALDAVEQVRRLNGPNGPQHQIAHITFVDPQDMPRFAALNVVADVSPMLWFPHSYTPLFELTVGRERTERSYPIGSLVKAGALVAGGSDWPAGQQTANPWIGIEGLVTRRNPLGEMPGVLNPAEGLSLDQALRIYSLNSARAMGLGAQAGSIEVGKSADWVVLNQPLFQIPPERIHQTQALETWFQGRRVHAAQAAQAAAATATRP
jgi:predicted amidohydrolase YtcJ